MKLLTCFLSAGIFLFWHVKVAFDNMATGYYFLEVSLHHPLVVFSIGLRNGTFVTTIQNKRNYGNISFSLCSLNTSTKMAKLRNYVTFTTWTVVMFFAVIFHDWINLRMTITFIIMIELHMLLYVMTILMIGIQCRRSWVLSWCNTKIDIWYDI